MKSKKISWGVTLFIAGYHLLMLALVPVYLMHQLPSVGLLLISFAVLYIAGLGITIGYHRCFSHLTFKTNPIIEAILTFIGTIAIQGSVLRWAHDHRLHHAHIDEDEDPYTVKRGFWHAHILWMIEKRPSEMDPKIIADLLKKPLLRFQDRFYIPLFILVNAFITYLIFLATGDLFGSIVWGLLVRLFLLHHFTWFINSLAHYWGHQHYSTEHSAVDNYILCFLTFGEGYHNYHHTFPADYRNGIRWYHFDPAKWIIFLLEKCGLATGLRRMNIAHVRKAMIEVHQKFICEKLKDKYADLPSIQALANRLTDKYAKLQEHLRNKNRTAIRLLKKELRSDWREWKLLIKRITKIYPELAHVH